MDKQIKKAKKVIDKKMDDLVKTDMPRDKKLAQCDAKMPKRKK